VDERIRQAGLLYEQSVFGGDPALLADADRHLDGVEADLAVARGRLMHTRFLLRRDERAGEPVEEPGELALFERARVLYRALGDNGGEAEALFWIGCFHQVVRQDDAAAVPALERALELAAQAGARATMSEVLRHLGVQGRRADALVLLDEAGALAAAHHAGRILQQVAEARAALPPAAG
jgi:hypothetical protein